MLNKKYVVFFDVDGTLTDGRMYYTADGKAMKAFGCDDWDMLKELHKYFEVHFISADKKGFPITAKRIRDEMGWNLHLVSHMPKERMDWMEATAGNREIIYMGDGVFDGYIMSLMISITTCDALEHVKSGVDYITSHSGGNRAVAEACIWILEKFVKEDWEKEILHE